ncbi:MAG TPA: hypothetical protein VEK57_16325 [Thermoanaerobaculia bacterium]|nr:hypothetical protein [Thermoanaerobaculia bacterium]
MTQTLRRVLLTFTATLMTLFLALFLTTPELARDQKRPQELEALGVWIENHPADWLAASALSDRALDSNSPRRRELWRTAYAHAGYLAPLRPNSAAGFVRAGLFHWYELPEDDRKAVLEVAATLLHDPAVFTSLYTPLWQLTRDLAYLRRVAPRTTLATAQLRDLAATHGQFDHYRQLRAELRASRLHDLQKTRNLLTPAELLAILPEHVDTADEPLVRAILEHLDRSAFDVKQLGEGAEKLARYALDHHVQPLTALASLCETPGVVSDATRARLALALGKREAATRIEMSGTVVAAKEWLPYYLDRAELEAREGNSSVAALYRARAATARDASGAWSETCYQNELCRNAVRETNGPLALRLSVVQSDETPPYVEIYVDDALAAEGEIADERSFTVGGPGHHRVELRLVNRHTRNGVQRRLRLS